MNEFEKLLKKFEEPKKEISKPDEKPEILVIDDDESIRRGLNSAFSHKYKVITAENGTMGQELLTRSIYCVILDVKMKELNGFSTYPKLKTKCPDVPIIFYTAFQSEHDLQEVINKHKPEGYVEKGKDISFLENLIENAVKKYTLILENESYKKNLEEKIEERTSELRKTNEELERTLVTLQSKETQLIQSEKLAAVSRLVAMLSHKLKNPSTTIGQTYRNLTTDISTLINEIVPKISSFKFTDLEYNQLKNIALYVFNTALCTEVPTEIERMEVGLKIEEGIPEDLKIKFKHTDWSEVSEKYAKYWFDKDKFETVLPLLYKTNTDSIYSILTNLFNIGNQLKNSYSSSKSIIENIQKVLNAANQEIGEPTEGVSINSVIDTSIDLLLHRLEKIELNKNYGDLPETICYPTDLMHTFIHIIENSIDAVRGEGQIDIETNYLPPHLKIIITDYGDGIIPEVREKMLQTIFYDKETWDWTWTI